MHLKHRLNDVPSLLRAVVFNCEAASVAGLIEHLPIPATPAPSEFRAARPVFVNPAWDLMGPDRSGNIEWHLLLSRRESSSGGSNR
ncbi:MAG: hypothetical protein JWO80_6184 [Bryobacterales bacterium]|nr:hypothetical protein [Bryobacterales bacterium]